MNAAAEDAGKLAMNAIRVCLISDLIGHVHPVPDLWLETMSQSEQPRIRLHQLQRTWTTRIGLPMTPSMYHANGTHRCASITAEVACNIVLDAHNGMLRPDLSKKYGLAVSTIGRIVTGHAWMNETLELRKSLRRQKQQAK